MSPEEVAGFGLNQNYPGLVFARGRGGLIWYPARKVPHWGIGEGHAICCAPSRSGKGIGFVIPNLLTWPGSVVCIDPKGENAFLTAERRTQCGNIYIIDPCGVSGERSARFNPLEWLRGSHDVEEDLRLIVEALTPKTSGMEDFWNSGARGLIRGLLYFLLALPGERKSLGRLYELLNSSTESWERTLAQMRTCHGPSDVFNQQAREAAHWFLGLHPEHQQYHRGTALYHLEWLAPVKVRQQLETSDFDLREIKSGVASIFLCLPPLSLSLYGGLSRLVTTLAIRAVMSKRAGKDDLPILFMLDEFATTIGQMKAFEESLTVIAGYGGRFAMIIQSIDQLQSLYPERRGTQSWHTLIENAGLSVFFNARGGTARYVSERMGQTTIPQLSATSQTKMVQRALLLPDEVSHPVDPHGEFVPDAVFAFVEGLPPIRARRLVSYRDSEFVNLHDPNRVDQQTLHGELTEWEKVEQYQASGVPRDSDHELPKDPPRITQEDLRAQNRAGGWDSTWS